MIKLQESRISHILPEYLSSQECVQALSFALNRAVEKFVGYCNNISVYAVVDSLPGAVLDMLALELGTQYYDASLPIQSRKALIKNTMAWYSAAGTPRAVEELVKSVFGEGEVREWYEYGDEPYFFKIITNAQINPDMNERFSEMIRIVKNARSHLAGIDITRNILQTLYSCGACVAVGRINNMEWEE